jgi:hypothetical protein
MKWTKEKPKKDGFYFVKCIGVFSSNEYVTVVKVYNNCEMVFYDGENFSIEYPRFVGWSDCPINPPDP